LKNRQSKVGPKYRLEYFRKIGSKRSIAAALRCAASGAAQATSSASAAPADGLS